MAKVFSMSEAEMNLREEVRRLIGDKYTSRVEDDPMFRGYLITISKGKDHAQVRIPMKDLIEYSYEKCVFEAVKWCIEEIERMEADSNVHDKRGDHI